MLYQKLPFEKPILFFCIIIISCTSLQCRKYLASKGNTPGSNWKKNMPGEWKIDRLLVDGYDWVPYFDSVFGGPGTLTVEAEVGYLPELGWDDRKSDFRFYYKWNKTLLANYRVDFEGDEYPKSIFMDRIIHLDYLQNYDKDTDDVLFNSMVSHIVERFCLQDSKSLTIYQYGYYFHPSNPYTEDTMMFTPLPNRKSIFNYLSKVSK